MNSIFQPRSEAATLLVKREGKDDHGSKKKTLSVYPTSLETPIVSTTRKHQLFLTPMRSVFYYLFISKPGYQSRKLRWML